jgi:hypothetical protein
MVNELEEVNVEKVSIYNFRVTIYSRSLPCVKICLEIPKTILP